MIEGLFRVRCTVSWHLVEDVRISYPKDISELTAWSFSLHDRFLKLRCRALVLLRFCY